MLLGDLFFPAVGFVLGEYIVTGHVVFSAAGNKYLLVFCAFLVFFFIMYDMYRTKTDAVYNAMISAAFSVVLSLVFSFFVAFAMRWELLSISVWAIDFCSIFFFVVVWRTGAAVYIKNYGDKRKVLILENMKNTSRLARKIKYSANHGREAVYYLIDEENEKEIKAIIDKKIREFDLIFILPAISDETTARIMNKAYMLRKDICVLADLDGVSTLRGKIDQFDDTPVIEKKGPRINLFQSIIKRVFDILCALIGLILSSPLFLICALAVKLDSKGPVIYRQERYTLNKKIFTVYKFRTMINNAEKNGAQLATEDDPRITRVGKFLRETRLDELPQLINILNGSMSVVGPRPERPVFADEFSKLVKNYDMRFCVKAGLTGYAQVYGKYNTRVSDKILMDIIYVINYSLLTDFKIILLTGKTMFIKSATEGVDEERDKELSSEENETKRREETLRMLGVENDSILHNTNL